MAKGKASENFNAGLIDFLGASPTPFHAVRTMAEQLREAGFTELREGEAWKVVPGSSYFVTRNGTALVAFRRGTGELESTGFRMVGAHTDSPCLKVKPHPELLSAGYLKIGVEVYGSPLLAPWFDRDLSLAGIVHYRDKQGKIAAGLVDFRRPIAVIPNLAIHLQREVNEGRPINRQTELPPVLCQWSGKGSFGAVLESELRLAGTEAVGEVLGWDLSFYDTQPPALVGLHQEFLASARLDNLLSCYVGMCAIREAGDGGTSVFVANDHEEVGSASSAGAQGPFLKSVLGRLVTPGESFMRAIDRSLFVSTDNAHGVHPNYAEKHDGNHGPLLNSGPVIKVNANQRYATSSETAAIFADLCARSEVPVQRFVVRSDMGCGSTIGPLTATALGVRTVDVGVPTFAMHSIRELAGVRDAAYLHRVLERWFE